MSCKPIRHESTKIFWRHEHVQKRMAVHGDGKTAVTTECRQCLNIFGGGCLNYEHTKARIYIASGRQFSRPARGLRSCSFTAWLVPLALTEK